MVVPDLVIGFTGSLDVMVSNPSMKLRVAALTAVGQVGELIEIERLVLVIVAAVVGEDCEYECEDYGECLHFCYFVYFGDGV